MAASTSPKRLVTFETSIALESIHDDSKDVTALTVGMAFSLMDGPSNVLRVPLPFLLTAQVSFIFYHVFTVLRMVMYPGLASWAGEAFEV